MQAASRMITNLISQNNWELFHAAFDPGLKHDGEGHLIMFFVVQASLWPVSVFKLALV
jgi:hypothetical protein